MTSVKISFTCSAISTVTSRLTAITPPKSGHWVARVGGAVGGGDGLLGHGNAAWVGVLDNHNAGALVVPRGAPRGIRILVVVVAHLLAIELGGIGKALGTDAGDSSRLVRVLAVAQRVVWPSSLS